MRHAAAKPMRGGAGTCELDSNSAHAETGNPDVSDPACDRVTACLLVELLTMALELPGRIGGRAAACAAPDGPGLLYPGRDRSAQPPWTVLYESRRSSVAVHL